MWGVVFGLLLTGTGAVLVAIGSWSFDAAETRRTALLEAGFVASPSSPPYDAFTRAGTFGHAMDEPAYTSVYLWNLTNAEHVLAGREPPRVAQVGPYVYAKTTRKVNVTFHTTLPPTTQGLEDATALSDGYGYVSYGVVTSYAFDAKRSNGSESDRVVTLNATYARTLAKYRSHGYSERLMVAEYAQRHMEAYDRHLRHEFVAETKQRGLQFFLPHAIDTVTRESVAPAIQYQRDKVDSASIPGNLVRMYAVARTEAIPQVLGDVMNDITDRFLPATLQRQFDAAKDHAMPRVLSNLFHRLKVEAVPVMLQKQIEAQYLRQVPFTLNALASKLPQLAFPYVVQELFERACLEAVPFVLRTIKFEIIARDTATNRNQADVAQNNVIEAWRLRSNDDRVDFDAWIDDSPTGQPRTGFELRPTTDSLQLSKEVATLLLGSKTSNKRFSIVDYDVQKTATYPLDVPVDTPVGYAIWKQVIAMNETSIAYLIDGVNKDVARPSDYVTREQVLFVREYLIQWAKSDVVLRDRERFWHTQFVKRTTNSDFNEPAVDLDIEKLGIQTGFNVHASGASTSGVTRAIARQLWTASDAFSFANVEGFTLWYEAAILQLPSASQALQAGITGLTSPQLAEISAWITNLLADGVVLRRALRHWADGTCLDSFKLPRPSCLLYDLEPHVPGVQVGFEMNPLADGAIGVTQALREELWDATKEASFLYAVQAADVENGYGVWMQAVRTGDTTDVMKRLTSSHPTLNLAGVAGISQWIRQWVSNDLHVLNIQNWWRTGTCWPREEQSKTSVTPTTTAALSTCTPSYEETELSHQVLVADDPQSPYSTIQRVIQVVEVECEWDEATSKYKKTESSYQLTAKEYACDAFSTELSDDHATIEFKTGFELAPLLTAAEAGLRPSLAVVSALWNPSNAFSFLHKDGYKQWVFDYAKDPSTVRIALADSINVHLPATCATLNGAGDRSSIFNVTLFDTDANCGAVTIDQVDVLQKWIGSISESSWMTSALLDQWRRGERTSSIDMEPYRPLKQSGWELSSGCDCSLTTKEGTTYEVPRAALVLWGTEKHQASFLSTKGYSLWRDLMNAVQAGDETRITDAKQQIVTACNLLTWEQWLDRVLSWLTALKSNEHLLRDVLGHWLHATCPTPSSLDVISVESEGSPSSSVQSTCPPAQERYQVSLKETLDDILVAASRPAFDQFFDPDIVEKSALIQPSKVVEETETIVTCDFQSTNQVTVTSQTRVTMKTYSSCNFLSVLADGTTAAMPIVQQETHFELNRSAEPSHISIEVALVAWVNSSETDWAFTNVDVFLTKWQRAIDRSDERTALGESINGAISAAEPSDLSDIAQYLKMWQTSSESVQEIGKLWLRSSSPFYDLDPTLEGSQAGFELFASAGWRKVFGSDSASLPSLTQAQLLWDAQNDYSFLNRKAELTGGLPIGFSAWREMYDGAYFSSERLVNKYPEEAIVERDSVVTYRLSESDRAALLALMAAATTLTHDQIRAIASWLMTWSENGVLRDYILETWATGQTPRGEEGATINLATYIPTRFDLKHLPAAAIPVDMMTTGVNPSILTSVPKLVRRKLWDVSTTGALLNPASRDVWCMVDLPNLGVCPHVLDDLGMVHETSFLGFAGIVQPVLQDSAMISRSSDLNALALQFFERQFALSGEQTLTIATWWRSLPTTSVYFQVLQAQKWQLATPQLEDPLWFGFGLASVFPTDKGRTNRRATAIDLVPNPVDLTPSICEISTELVVVLWRRSNPASFLHGSMWELWLEYAEQDHPRDTSSFLQSISDVDTTVHAIVDAVASESARCSVEAFAHWLLSWKSHPLTRNLVERLWYQASTSPTSPVTRLENPSALLSAIPVDKGVLHSPRPTPMIRLHARIAEIVLDANESVAWTNLTVGFPMWRALLTDCTSTNAISLKCEASQATEQARQTAVAAAAALSRELTDRVKAIDPSLSATEADVDTAIRLVIVPLLLYWLDHELLLRFVLQHAADVDASLQTQVQSLTFGDFPAIQFTSATFSRVEYQLPQYYLSDDDSYHEQKGVASERLTQERWVFDREHGSVVRQKIRGSAGFGELAAFCEWNKYDRVFAYDSTTECSLRTAYDISISEANAMLTVFADPTEWTVLNGGPRIKRAALLLDAFLAQPFASSGDCSFVMENLALAYSFSPEITQRTCKTTADGVWLDLPLLSTMGLASPLAKIKDLQAYLKYAATKFVYEPSVLSLLAHNLHADNLTQTPPNLDTWNVYPVGGLIASQPVATVASPYNVATSLWQTAASNQSYPSVNTFLVPTRQDHLLLSKSKERVLGELVALNGSTKALILAATFRLRLGHFTDGSQFTTAILAGRHDPVSPPPQLRFYWDYARRIVVLNFAKNVTRFGIPLMRYTVENWQEPTNLPSGLDAAAVADSSLAPTNGVNVSKLFDDLSSILSLAPATPLTGPLEQSRETAVDIDPVTGSVYHRRLSWQLTTRITTPDTDGDLWHKDVTAGWLPVVWVREQQSVSPSKALEVVAMTTKPGPFAKEKLALWGVVGGCVYMVVGLAMSLFYAKRARMVRIRKQQSVMPAGTVTASANGVASPKGKEPDPSSDKLSRSVDPHVHEASDVSFAASNLMTVHTSPRARKRTASRVQTIAEDREEALDLQQA